MKRLAVALVALVLVASGCSGGSTERTILVDYSSDEFASFYLFNFPTKLFVHPGDTLLLRQTWTGEPHTFTGGTSVSNEIRAGAGWLDFFDGFEGLVGSGEPLPDPEDAGDATFADFAAAVKGAKPSPDKTKFTSGYNALRDAGTKLPDLDDPSTEPFSKLVSYVEKTSEEAFADLPLAFSDDSDELSQNAAQPCYLRTGRPPSDPKQACSKAQQRQPAFDGTQSYYSSGVIPYEGAGGNTFRVPLSSDIKPGSYFFYCAVHSAQQRTEVVVRPPGATIPGESQVTREVRKEIEDLTAPLRKQYRDAADGRFSIPGGPPARGPFAGLTGTGHTAINEFVPNRLRAKAGEPITWTMTGAQHTISFNPPTYFPPVEFLKNGTVRLNPRLSPPAGGAKAAPDELRPGAAVDGGTFDGTGFWSSGLIGNDSYIRYTMRVSKPGTYKFACLLHPPMVGTLVVS